jgi:hypothetical protein
MNFDWLADGQKTSYYIWVMVVNSIRVLGQSPEVIVKAYKFNRVGIYRPLVKAIR